MNKDVVNAELLGVLSMFPRYCAEAPERLSMSRDEACIAVSSLIFTATTELGAKSGLEAEQQMRAEAQWHL